MEIRLDDLRDARVIALLAEHLADMRSASPPESCHVLGVDALRAPEVTLWTLWCGTDLAGCAALKELDHGHGEIKSMRTARAWLRQGVASALLRHLIAEATRRGYRRLSLETGAMDCFEPAQRLYEGFGFEVCGPFAGYAEDPLSVFMSKELA